MIAFVNDQVIVEVFRRNIEFPEIYNKTVKKLWIGHIYFVFYFILLIIIVYSFVRALAGFCVKLMPFCSFHENAYKNMIKILILTIIQPYCDFIEMR